jgi:hypothetical protein
MNLFALERRQPDATTPPNDVGRLPSTGATPHEFTRIKRAWQWQAGFHDHKFRTPESESRKWEYVCLNVCLLPISLIPRPDDAAPTELGIAFGSGSTTMPPLRGSGETDIHILPERRIGGHDQ